MMPSTEKHNAVIFDLDGTLADIEHRRHLVTEEKKLWDEFYKRCSSDVPKADVIQLLRQLSAKNKIIILSGRSDVVYKETVEWLEKHGIEYDVLKMRRDGNYMPDEMLKEEWYYELMEDFNIWVVFDDRDKVVKMWRKNNLLCCQVAKGDF